VRRNPAPQVFQLRHPRFHAHRAASCAGGGHVGRRARRAGQAPALTLHIDANPEARRASVGTAIR
jgi:hypothetical protein